MSCIRIKNQKNVRIFILAIIALLILIFSGCASTPKINPELVKKYQSPVSIGEKETLIYVIRQNTFVGAAQHLWVGCNDQYIAELGAGEYCYFKVPAALNTINLRQMQIPLAFYRVDFRPSEIIFLYFEYTKGLISEIDKDLGMSIVMSFEEAKKYDGPDKNTDFEIGLMNPDYVNIGLMKESATTPKLDKKYALVSFIRPQSFAQVLAFGIWNQDGFLGSLKGKNYFTVKLSPGKHTFIANSRYYSALKAHLEAGKHYYVLVEASMGWAQANIDLLPVKNEIKQSEIQEWMDKSVRIEMDKSAIDENIKNRLEAAMPLVGKTITNIEKGELEADLLEGKDGRD